MQKAFRGFGGNITLGDHNKCYVLLFCRRHNCQKCMVIHEKHPNVLQYKESKDEKNISKKFCNFMSFVTGYCHASSGFSGSLESLCSSIESDSPLFFIFRTRRGDKKLESEACPFKNIEYAFSYSTRGGAKVCQQPPSRLDTCTDEAKMVFQFQACPDVPGSERTGESLNSQKCIHSIRTNFHILFPFLLKGLL